MVTLVKMPPYCTFCKEFRYKKGAEKIYRCKINCECSNDIFELFENCPYLHLHYGVKVDVEENENDVKDDNVGGWHSAEEYFEKFEEIKGDDEGQQG